jgi:dehydrogenase/reductase SDR family protein 7B
MAHGETFAGRVVWITGASSGIGRELALAFDRKGAKLILSSRRREALEEVRARCREPGAVEVVPLDLAEPEALPDIASDVLLRRGRVDIMVHNAGVAHRDLAVDTPVSIDRRIMETNYFGPVTLTKALLPHMLERGSGRFVVVSSMSGVYGAPRVSAYAASKHALHGFFESLRAELHGAGVHVTIVIPGFIRTPITEHALTGTGAPYGRSLAIHERGMSAAECADRILRAVAAGKEEALVGGSEILTVYLNRLFPRLLARIVRSHPVRTKERWLSRLPWRSREGR